MKNKLLAAVLAFCLVLSLCATALAADGDVPTNYAKGSATVTSSDGKTFITANDNDDVAAPDDTNGSDVMVWVYVTSEPDSSPYKLDVAWGAMTFTYSGGNGAWNPDDHAYAANTEAGWKIDESVNGENNKITIRNHSRWDVETSFAYTMNGTYFNDTDTGDSVVGGFFATNEIAQDAAAVLTNTASINLSKRSTYRMPGATKKTETSAGAPSTFDTYFAFSGTPDTAKTLDTYTNVGTITITFKVVA